MHEARHGFLAGMQTRNNVFPPATYSPTSFSLHARVRQEIQGRCYQFSVRSRRHPNREKPRLSDLIRFAARFRSICLSVDDKATVSKDDSHNALKQRGYKLRQKRKTRVRFFIDVER